MKKKLAFLFMGMTLLAGCSAGPSSSGSGGGTADSSGSASGGNAQSGDTIKIGVNLELSGAVAAYGTAEEQGIDLAVEQINADGGIDGKQIEIVKYDNTSNNTEAATVTANLTENDDVVAIIGPATSGAVQSALPNATSAQVPIVTPSGTADAITVSDSGSVQEYAFRSCFQDSFQGTVLAQYAEDTLNAENVIILGDNSSDYAIGLTDAFEAEFSGNIVSSENFTSGDTDFQTVLTNIANQDFDVLYVPGYYAEAGLIIKQAREMGITQPIIGADGFGDSQMVDIAGASNVTDVYYTAHFSANAPANDTVSSFISAFEAEYSTTPSAFNALAYDAVYMIKQAIEDQGSADSNAITEGLASLKGFEGVTGTMTIDADHNPEKSAVVIGLTDGAETSAETVEPA
ncbi:ABC transporter substrate-binding protein [Enterococcus sp. HY326]|uniref:ABC transporter substrate-binding protein n=1 Tax=Enterococcus sp. HY326 TaxID=2971265 RepID=UPI00223F53C7|nr:ABC transporter substrate-binding protein [Enterococcus sp. HY326]